jgi:hypothetical protein
MGCVVIGQVSMLQNKTNKTTFLIVMDWLISCELVSKYGIDYIG